MIFGKKRKIIKNCALYISDKHNHLVIAPRMGNKDGLNVEHENSNGFDLPISEEDLGQEIIDVMNNINLLILDLKERKCKIGQRTKLQKANQLEHSKMIISTSAFQTKMKEILSWILKEDRIKIVCFGLNLPFPFLQINQK
jgi:hypothetical protein